MRQKLAMRTTLRLLVAAVAGALFLAPSTAPAPRRVTHHYDDGYVPEERLADYTHLTARLRIDPWKQEVSGTTEFAFLALRDSTDLLKFWIPGIAVASVSVNGSPARFEARGEDLEIVPPEPVGRGASHRLSITYTAHPNRDCFFIGWNDPDGFRRKQVWAHRPFSWIPFVNDRLTTDFFLTFDADYELYTNGERVAVTGNADGTRTWHYRMTKDHPFFSTCLVAGKYAYRSLKTRRGLPVELWYYPDMEDHFEPTYRHTLDIFDFMEEELGVPYPYPLYRQAPVTDYLFGGMETTTSTVYGDFLLVDTRAWHGRNFLNVNAHELIHQWFGNCLNHQCERDCWLTEGITTHYAKHFERSLFGEDHFQTLRRSELEKVLEVSAKETFPMASGMRAVPVLYQKGSLVMDMLRGVIGDREFREVMRHYFARHAFGEVKTGDLLDAVRAVTGRTLDWFFDEWVHRGGEPHYRVAYSVMTDDAGNKFTRVGVEQIQKVDDLLPLFGMPIGIEVHYADGSMDRKEPWIEAQRDEVRIPNSERKDVAFVLFDPGSRIIKRLTFERTFEQLRAQLTTAKAMIDRHEALVAMRELPVETKRDALLRRYEGESWHLMKAEILTQLVGDADPRSVDLLRRGLLDPDALVRRAVVTHLTTVPPSLKGDYETLLRDSCYINLATALANLSASFPGEVDRYLETTQAEIGWRGMNIRIQWLEIAVGSGKDGHREELIGYASPRYEYETRANAMKALINLNLLDPVAAGFLLRGALYWNPRVSDAASEALRHFYKQRAFRGVIDAALRSAALSQKDEKTLRTILSP